MPLQATSGAASYDAFGGGVPVVPNYIEEVFSTYVYKGTGSQNQNITNGIDLSTKGGLVWIKSRIVTGLDDHWLQDTARGIRNGLNSNTTNAQNVNADVVTAVLTNGYTDSVGWGTSDSVASWTFRKQPKFFDVVTYTGNGTTQNISHNLGSVPACIFIKRTDGVTNWPVYHRSLGNDGVIFLNTTNTVFTGVTTWNNTTPTSTVFSIGSSSAANENGGTYVAYLFAHDAGGFGLTGTDNVISCGTFTTNGSGVGTVTLGYEPQWVLWKKTTGTAADWFLVDNMRGMPTTGVNSVSALRPNSSAVELTGADYTQATATGFVANSSSSSDFIYIAIRRGPMKVPTSGTSVFNTNTATSNLPAYPSNFPVDLQFQRPTGGDSSTYLSARLTGLKGLFTNNTDAEYDWSYSTFDYQNGWYSYTGFGSGNRSWMFRRAPSFLDVVCYSGNGATNRAVTHNLTVIPEICIVKERTDASGGYTSWWTYLTNIDSRGSLNSTGRLFAGSAYRLGDSVPTATTLYVGNSNNVDVTNSANSTYVAYLFATCAGVSKVGSYTGTGTTKQIDCGFTGGARFVLIKRTDSTGDWYYWDSARGIVSGNDPYLLLNSTAAEVTNTDYIDTYSAGFEISSTAPSAINASGGSFVFLAIA